LGKTTRKFRKKKITAKKRQKEKKTKKKKIGNDSSSAGHLTRSISLTVGANNRPSAAPPVSQLQLQKVA